MKIKSLYIKLLFITFISLSVIYLIIKLQKSTLSFFESYDNTLNKIDKIYHDEIHLNYAIIRYSMLNDINVNKIKKHINILQKDISNLDKTFKEISFKDNLFEIYKQRVNKKINEISLLITNLNTLNNLNKEIQKLILIMPQLKQENKISFTKAKIILQITKTIINNKHIENKINFLQNEINKEIKSTKSKFELKLLTKLNDYIKTYLVFKSLLNNILNKKDFEIIEKIMKEYTKNKNREKHMISSSLKGIIALIIIYTTLIVILIIYLEKENKHINSLLKQIKNSSQIDSLTWLYNRNRLNIDLQNSKKNMVVYILNIKKFKTINHIYGMEIGDKLLIEIAHFIREIVPNKIDIYRLNGDEFAILKEKENDKCEILAIDIVNNFEKHTFNVDGIDFKVSVNIGLSCIPPYIENAYIALYKAKQSSRLKYMKYSNTIDDKEIIKKNVQKAKLLMQAFKENRIIPAYQPIFNIHTNKIEKYEVLARVLHKDGRIESIFPYLQIIKDNKLYYTLTKTIISKAFENLKDKDIEFSINFSVEDINDENIISFLISKLDKKISKKLTIEILESENINNYTNIKNFINVLHRQNISISIDDFGSGFSNFEHLANLDIDFLKIDGSLIKNIDKNIKLQKLVESIISFAKFNNIKTVAEFVETKEEFETVKRLGVDYIQGYYIGKPTLSI